MQRNNAIRLRYLHLDRNLTLLQTVDGKCQGFLIANIVLISHVISRSISIISLI